MTNPSTVKETILILVRVARQTLFSTVVTGSASTAMGFVVGDRDWVDSEYNKEKRN